MRLRRRAAALAAGAVVEGSDSVQNGDLVARNTRFDGELESEGRDYAAAGMAATFSASTRISSVSCAFSAENSGVVLTV